MLYSRTWKLLAYCAINLKLSSFRSLYIKIKGYCCCFQPCKVVVWKLTFRTMKGLCFPTPNWNLCGAEFLRWVRAAVHFHPFCCPFLRGGKQPFFGCNLTSAGDRQPLSIIHLCVQTQSSRAATAVISISTATAWSCNRGFPSYLCLSQLVISSHALKCTSLAELVFVGLVWHALVLCQATLTGCLESSIKPKQHLVNVNLSSHFHSLVVPFTRYPAGKQPQHVKC